MIETNGELEDSPELINKDAFGEGWLFKLKIVDESEIDNMMDADSRSYLAEQMDKFFSGDQFDQVEGFVPPTK